MHGPQCGPTRRRSAVANPQTDNSVPAVSGTRAAALAAPTTVRRSPDVDALLSAAVIAGKAVGNVAAAADAVRPGPEADVDRNAVDDALWATAGAAAAGIAAGQAFAGKGDARRRRGEARLWRLPLRVTYVGIRLHEPGRVRTL